VHVCSISSGFTDSEKAFAIFAELIVGSVIYGGLAAVLSAAMMEAQQSSEEFNKNYKALKAWMSARKVAGNYQKMVLASCVAHIRTAVLISYSYRAVPCRARLDPV
jgi:hypothetical protein